MKFREIDEAIVACVDPETGEVDAEKLEALQGENDKKMEALALWVMDLKSDAKDIDEEIKRLKARKEAVENKVDSLRAFLAFRLDGGKLKTPLVSISSRVDKAVIIDDIDKLPAEFVKSETVKKADKIALRKAFNEWAIIDGAHIEQTPGVTIR